MSVKTSSKKPVSGLAFFVCTLCLAYLAWPDDIQPAPAQTPKTPDSPSIQSFTEPQPRARYYRKAHNQSYRSTDYHHRPKPAFATPRYSQTPTISLDINEADSIDWVQIPGIGPKTARRIIETRNKLKGFYSTAQLLEVYYFDSNLLHSQRVHFAIEPHSWAGIPWDSLQEKEDLYHPYLSPRQRNSLWAYKQQHPEFHPALGKRPLCIDSQTWTRIKPYFR